MIAMVLIAVRQLSAATGTEVIVSVADQILALVDGEKVVVRYPVSTSKFGSGDNVGSIEHH